MTETLVLVDGGLCLGSTKFVLRRVEHAETREPVWGIRVPMREIGEARRSRVGREELGDHFHDTYSRRSRRET
ncbi:hypothetical protein [Methanopyrus sp.]